MNDQTSEPRENETKKLVWKLGWVSFFTDVSSDAIIPTLPFFITVTLGASAVSLGAIEGIAEATSAILKAPSGIISDLSKHRKPLVVLGYLLSVLGKLALPLAFVVPTVLGARFLDRIGKGIRTSPRDGILADGVEQNRRGWAFGIHRMMDSSGAVLAPLLALLFLTFYPGEYRMLYWLALIPAVISVLILLSVKEPPKHQSPKQHTIKGVLPANFRRYLLIMTLFSLGNSSDVFLLLRLKQLGWTPTGVLLAYAGFNIVAAAGAIPFGKLSDQIGRKRALILGFCVFALVYLGFAVVTPELSWLGIILLIGYGLYYALTDGVGRAFAADLAGQSWRGSGLGIYHTCIGLAALPASILAGALIDKGYLALPYFIGSFAALIAIVGLQFSTSK